MLNAAGETIAVNTASRIIAALNTASSTPGRAPIYFQQTGAHLAPVLDTLQVLRHETHCWFEITTLLIPEHDDSDAEIEAMTCWIADGSGPTCRCTSRRSIRTTR